MRINNHRLHKDNGTPYSFVHSPNCGGPVQHEYLVIHFTAGRSAESSVSWFANPSAKASAHLVIGRDGSITQQVPFDRIAWHAGQSRWAGLTGLNSYSIGIELDNAGPLKRSGSRWQAWFGAFYDDNDVIEAVHKDETKPRGWHTYTAEQIDAALEVGLLLMETYELRDVVGHEDIAPHRKIDPGPAFGMRSFKARLTGRAVEDAAQYETTLNLNIRSGPGTQNALLIGSPLTVGTRVEVLAREGLWWQVDVVGTVNGVMDLQGWVHSKYLKRS